MMEIYRQSGVGIWDGPGWDFGWTRLGFGMDRHCDSGWTGAGTISSCQLLEQSRSILADFLYYRSHSSSSELVKVRENPFGSQPVHVKGISIFYNYILTLIK